MNRGPFGVAPRSRILPVRSMVRAIGPMAASTALLFQPASGSTPPIPVIIRVAGVAPSSIRQLSSSPSVTSRVWSSRQDTSMLGTWTAAVTEPKYRGQVSSGAPVVWMVQRPSGSRCQMARYAGPTELATMSRSAR